MTPLITIKDCLSGLQGRLTKLKLKNAATLLVMLLTFQLIAVIVGMHDYL